MRSFCCFIVVLCALAFDGLLLCALVLVSCLQQPSEVAIVNKSGVDLRDVTVTVEKKSQKVPALPMNETSLFYPRPSDSRIVSLQFECNGKVRKVRDCGCMDSTGENRIITILEMGNSVSIDFGGGVISNFDCE